MRLGTKNGFERSFGRIYGGHRECLGSIRSRIGEERETWQCLRGVVFKEGLMARSTTPCWVL